MHKPQGGHSNVKGGYQAHPKIHLIRVVFQDQALYARTSLRGTKTCKIGKKGCVFGHIDKFWKEHDRQIKKNACKNAYLGSIFIPEKYVIRVLFVCPWTSLIPPLAIRVAPWGTNCQACHVGVVSQVKIGEEDVWTLIHFQLFQENTHFVYYFVCLVPGSWFSCHQMTLYRWI